MKYRVLCGQCPPGCFSLAERWGWRCLVYIRRSQIKVLLKSQLLCMYTHSMGYYFFIYKNNYKLRRSRSTGAIKLNYIVTQLWSSYRCRSTAQRLPPVMTGHGCVYVLIEMSRCAHVFTRTLGLDQPESTDSCKVLATSMSSTEAWRLIQVSSCSTACTSPFTSHTPFPHWCRTKFLRAKF